MSNTPSPVPSALPGIGSYERSRGSPLSVPSAKATGSELKTIKRALENPPRTPDTTGAVLTVSSAVLVGYKILTGHVGAKAPALETLELLVLLAVVACVIYAVVRYVDGWRKNPLNEQAREYVDQLIAVEKGVHALEPAAPPTKGSPGMTVATEIEENGRRLR